MYILKNECIGHTDNIRYTIHSDENGKLIREFIGTPEQAKELDIPVKSAMEHWSIISNK